MYGTSKSRLVDIAFLQLSIIILSVAGVLSKKASTLDFLSVEFIAYYSLTIFIMSVYAILWQQIIKKFELSVAYANKGTIIIWTFIWAVLFFQETITLNNILGAVLVIAGIVMVFKDAK
ncbi:MAG: EamA family transporter [Firmicutes bacterium]|nr:EamA family transporter [Bacillota bacterium]